MMNILLSTLLMMGLAAPAQNSPSTGNAGSAAKGKASFTFYACSACHGYSGQGGVGPRLAATALSQDALMKYVRKPAGVMPRYSTESQITDATLTDIYAFLKSIPPPADPKTITLLQAN